MFSAPSGHITFSLNSMCPSSVVSLHPAHPFVFYRPCPSSVCTKHTQDNDPTYCSASLCCVYLYNKRNCCARIHLCVCLTARQSRKSLVIELLPDLAPHRFLKTSRVAHRYQHCGPHISGNSRPRLYTAILPDDLRHLMNFSYSSTSQTQRALLCTFLQISIISVRYKFDLSQQEWWTKICCHQKHKTRHSNSSGEQSSASECVQMQVAAISQQIVRRLRSFLFTLAEISCHVSEMCRG